MGRKGISKYSKSFKIGDVFGSWTVVGDVTIAGEAKVKVQCKCGAVNDVSCYSIKISASTGCLKCDQEKRSGAGNSNWRGFKDIPGSFVQRYSRKVRNKGMEWNLSLEYLNNMYLEQDRKCALTGIPISFENENLEVGYKCTASIDRIDSKKGYIIGNVQLVHKDINMMKNKYNQEYFIEMCKLVSQKYCNES